MRTMVALEDSACSIAMARDEPTVVLLDRGMADAMAYIDEEEFADLVGRLGMTPKEVMARYDSVVHLVTAAKGAKHA